MGKIEENKDTILHLYLVEHYSANRIAEMLEVSRQGVILALNSWGIDTSLASGAAWVEVTCQWKECGKAFKIRRSRYREKKEENAPFFCCTGCYQKWFREQFS